MFYYEKSDLCIGFLGSFVRILFSIRMSIGGIGMMWLFFVQMRMI